ncbi:hypothetical protein B0H19DRAFT_1249424 [Mycena capillaripes]|nr:hypothetical protein B0H19DRAFT_1249424 [Mycena capillaripes]
MSVPTIAARHSLIPLDKILGPWFIGLMVSSVIFGITCLQVYMYFTKHCARDPIGLKVFVGCLLTVEILHLVMLGMSYYETSITNFGDFVEVFKGPWSLRAQIIIGVFLGMLVQMFYAYRIWTLSHKSPYIPVLIVGALSLSIVYTIRATITLKEFENTADVIPFSTGSLSLEVVCDVLITGGMVYNLLQGRTEFSRTNRALNTLIYYTVNSGALTSVFAMCTLIFFVVSKTTLIYAFFFFILVRLYGLSFILNSREYVRKQLTHELVTIPTHSSPTARTQSSQEKTMDTLVFAQNQQHASTLSV